MTKFKLTILMLLITAFGVAVSGCIKKPALQPAVNGNQPVNTNTSTTTAEIDTSDWKTYRNEEYGFEFKYPLNIPLGQELSSVSMDKDNSLVLGSGWIEVLSRDDAPLADIISSMVEVGNNVQITNITKTNNFMHMIIGEKETGQKVGISFHQIISPSSSSKSGILLSAPVRLILVRGPQIMIGYWSEDITNTQLWDSIFMTIKFR